MSEVSTSFEFRCAAEPVWCKLYRIGMADTEILGEALIFTEIVDPEADEIGRWRAQGYPVSPATTLVGDVHLIARDVSLNIIADERYTVTANNVGGIIQPWSEAKPLTLAEITSAVSTLLNAATIEYVSPYNEQTGELTLAQRCDYKDGTVIGPLRWEIDNEAVDAGDTIRFGAALNRPFLESASDQKINATGTVVDEAGTLYAVVELSKEEHTDRLPGTDWRWELEHIDGDGNVSPLYSDQKMILKPRQLGALATMATPEEYNRSEPEAAIATLLSERFAEVRAKLDRQEFVDWAAWREQTRKELEDELAAVFIVLFMMRRPDKPRASTLALRFASSTTGALLDSLTRNFRAELSGGLDFDRVFSPRRAEAIAATEVTRAITQGETAARFEIYADDPANRASFLGSDDAPPIIISDGLVAIWQTEEDGRVCPLCGPLNNKPAQDWIGQFPQGPPAHVNCRCWLIYESE